MTNQKTPPMGWNSWDCYGAAVNEEITRKNALFMAENLKKYGWEFVVVDIQWASPTATDHVYLPFSELCMDEYGRLIPAPNRFPSAKDGAGFKPLADYIHSLGLKFGIHIMRGIPRLAAHRNLPIYGTTFTAQDAANPYSTCRWNPDMYGVLTDKEAGQAYYDSIMELYAGWGVDFIKVDDIANHYPEEEIEMIERAMNKTGRDMILSLSPGPAPLEKAEHLKQHANMWRITDDFWDKWELLYDMFSRAQNWSIHTLKGHWPDADMLPIGPILQDYNKENWTKFTKDEQITMMTLWCIMRSPLMIGGEMTGFDDFTMSLLTNEDLIHMLNHSHSAHQVFRHGQKGKETIGWMATDEEEGYYIALFNADDTEKTISLNLSDAGLTGSYKGFDLWNKQDAKFDDAQNTIIKATVPSHGAYVAKITRK